MLGSVFSVQQEMIGGSFQRFHREVAVASALELLLRVDQREVDHLLGELVSLVAVQPPLEPLARLGVERAPEVVPARPYVP